MIEYIDDIHTYLIDGVIVPSVSQLCTHATRKSFEGIPSEIVRAKAEYGTSVHKLIEDFEKGLEVQTDSPYLTASLNEHTALREQYASESIEMERIVGYKREYAGRLDILAGQTLVDIKTTYQPDIEWLQWQLGYYKLALAQEGVTIKKCYLEWLPKGKAGKLIQIIPKTDSELLRNLKEYTYANA